MNMIGSKLGASKDEISLKESDFKNDTIIKDHITNDYKRNYGNKIDDNDKIKIDKNYVDYVNNDNYCVDNAEEIDQINITNCIEYISQEDNTIKSNYNKFKLNVDNLNSYENWRGLGKVTISKKKRII